MDEIEARLRDRAGNGTLAVSSGLGASSGDGGRPSSSALPLPEAQIDRLVQRFKK
jgi:hypothetical protein